MENTDIKLNRGILRVEGNCSGQQKGKAWDLEISSRIYAPEEFLRMMAALKQLEERYEHQYKREMRHNYLILEAAGTEEENFEIRMLTENSIEGLLKFRVKQEEIGRYYCYEITSKQPLSRLLEFKEIKKEELMQYLEDEDIDTLITFGAGI